MSVHAYCRDTTLHSDFFNNIPVRAERNSDCRLMYGWDTDINYTFVYWKLTHSYNVLYLIIQYIVDRIWNHKVGCATNEWRVYGQIVVCMSQKRWACKQSLSENEYLFIYFKYVGKLIYF